MTRKELRNRLETGTATEQDYELITSIIISEMTTDSLKKLNPNWLYHINNLTFKKISDEAFDTLYELSMQSTLEREDEFVFKNAYTKTKKIKYKVNVNTDYMSRMAAMRFTIEYNKHSGKSTSGQIPNQEFCKVSGAIRALDLGYITSMSYTTRSRMEESGELIVKYGGRSADTHYPTYYDYNAFLEVINDKFKRAEKDTFSPEYFKEIPFLLNKKKALEILGKDFAVVLRDTAHPIYKYLSYFSFSDKKRRFTIDSIIRVKPIMEEMRNKKGKKAMGEMRKREELFYRDISKEYEEAKKMFFE